MKNVRSICGKALLLFLCTVLLLLAGCSGLKPNPYYKMELTDENSIEIVFVNASGCPLGEILAYWANRKADDFDLLHNLDRDLEPDEVMELRIPNSDDGVYHIIAPYPAEGYYHLLPDWSDVYLPNGSVLVLLPYFEDHEKLHTIFEPGTDVETAKAAALAEYEAACEAAIEAKKAAEEDAKKELLPEHRKKTLDKAPARRYDFNTAMQDR